jgi:hypothetical protein
MWSHITFIFKIVQRRGADCTLNHLVPIEHCKLNDHPIEIEAQYVASLKRHCEFSTWEFHCATSFSPKQNFIRVVGRDAPR